MFTDPVTFRPRRHPAVRPLGAALLLLVLLLAWGVSAIAFHAHPCHHEDLSCTICRLVVHAPSTAPAAIQVVELESDDGQLPPPSAHPVPPPAPPAADHRLRAPPAA